MQMMERFEATHAAARRGDREAQRDPGYIPGLDGLRAVAIFGVVLAHQFTQYDAVDGLRGVARLIAVESWRGGEAGVRLFFAISGFLICSRLLGELAHARPGAVLRSFYVRRAFRILPPLVPYLGLLTLCAALGWLPIRRKELVAAALFLSNYVTGKSWYTHHFWSLAVEEHFYLLWAPLLAFAGRRRAAIVAGVIIIVTAIVRPLIVNALADPSHAVKLTHLLLDAFMFPCLLAIVLAHPAVRERAASLARGGTMLTVLAALALTPALPSGLGVPGFDPRGIQALLLAVIVALPSLAPMSLMTRVLEQRTLTWVGRRSYGIYIWQQLIFTPSTASLSHKVLVFPMRLVAVLAVAEISFRFLERPMLARGRALARRFAPAPEPLRDDTVDTGSVGDEGGGAVVDRSATAVGR